jgi:hypothetical protein
VPLLIDEAATETAIRRWALPTCLHVPIAAVDEAAIRTYIGDTEPLGRPPHRAFVVTVTAPAAIDPLLPINDHPNASILHASRQVWVHIAFNRYRAAYRKAFPDEDIDGRILSHAMNRRTAALKGFDFVRITTTSRANNSSSSFSEKWAVELHGSAEQMGRRRLRPPYIQYGDLSDLMLMLDMKLGGGVMDAVNAGQKLIERKTANS